MNKLVKGVSQTQAVLSRLKRERESASMEMGEKLFSFSLALTSLKRQRTYLAWTSFSMLLQLTEMAILAVIHYVYFPPISLELLRFLSAVSVLALMTSYWMREMPRSELQKSDEVLFAAKLSFFITLAIALLLTVLLLARTNLALSTPPIYRALLLSSLVIMPFDALTCFMFYNLREFPTTWRPRFFRLFAFSMNSIALMALWYDQPLLFFTLKLLPRVIVVQLLWTKCTRQPFATLFSLHALVHQGAWPVLKHRLRELSSGVLLFLISEGVFLYAYRPLTRIDSNLAVVFFVAHKLAHILTVLSVKVRMSLIRDWRYAKTLESETDKTRVRRKGLAVSLIYFGVTLLFAPLIFVKLNIAFWASPTGEHFHLNGGLLAASLFLVLCRAYLAGTTPLIMGEHVQKRVWVLSSVALLAVLLVGTVLIPFFFARADLSDLLYALMLIDALTCLGIALAVETVGFAARAPRALAHDTLAELLETAQKEFHKNVGKHFAAKVVFLSSVKLEEADVERLFAEQLGLVKQSALVRTAWQDYLLLFCGVEEAELRMWQRQFFLRHGAIVQALEVQSVSTLREIVSFYHSGDKKTHRPEQKKKAQESLREITAAKRAPENGRDNTRIVLSATNDWQIPAEVTPAERYAIKRFLLRLFSDGEYLLPLAYESKMGRGYFHLNKSGRPQTVIYLPPERRDFIDELRTCAFERNIKDYLKGSQA